jgi:pimeloyl-ACP methyl ester carboxylesterase
MAIGILLMWTVLTIGLRWIARQVPTKVTLQKGAGRQLLVLVHGLPGRQSLDPLIELARATFRHADLLTIAFDVRLLSNADVFAVTNELEAEIHAAFELCGYESIVLVGHSMGAMLARKALLWGHGLEEDRKAPKGRRRWVERVDRVVSLAGINRGWSIEPRPDNMTTGRFLSIWIGEIVARLTGTGKMLLAMQRGAPFVADSRVQWIRLTRAGDNEGSTKRPLPQVIHVLGDLDDLVSRADATDLGVARETVFVTLAGTNHVDIVSEGSLRRQESIRLALLGDVDALSPDRTQELVEHPAVKRVIYVMHGIRDYGGWTDRVREGIRARVAALHEGSSPPPVAVVNKKYGYFPMLRFLLYWDRQRNVRVFMDEYTENVARYPNAERFDFIGHSNGTYILASALQRYRTIAVGRIYFAGSVVPKHYPWRNVFDGKRAQRVVNVVAAGDWVVAIFPKFFEQIADWLNVQPTRGVLDIGAAGFRGFQAGEDPQGRLVNVEFAKGTHSAGVDARHEAKLAAIVGYAVDGDESGMSVFRTGEPWGWLNVISNLSWLVCIGLVVLLYMAASLAFTMHAWAGILFVLIVVGLLMSV